MSLLIAVKSCAQHLQLGYHYAIRETWGSQFPSGTVKFFIGDNMQKHEADEAVLACPDDYDSLPLKTQAICRWAVGKKINHLFICDTDTFVKSKELLTCGYENYDYAGKIDRPLGETFQYTAVDRQGAKTVYSKCYPYASGGYGYFLSRKAFSIIADRTPVGWAEDLLTGQALGPLYLKGEVSMLNIPGGSVSEHFPAHEYASGYDLKFQWMQKKFSERG